MGKRVTWILLSKSQRTVVFGIRQQIESPFSKCRFRVPGGVQEELPIAECQGLKTSGEPSGRLSEEGQRVCKRTGLSEVTTT